MRRPRFSLINNSWLDPLRGGHKLKSLLVVIILILGLLLPMVSCEGFFKKLFNLKDKQVERDPSEEQKQQDNLSQAIKDLDPKLAAIALELTKLDEQLSERRKQEGREENYTKLMSKAKEQASGYQYHQQHQQESSQSLCSNEESTTNDNNDPTLKVPNIDRLSTLKINPSTPMENNPSLADDYLPSGDHYKPNHKSPSATSSGSVESLASAESSPPAAGDEPKVEASGEKVKESSPGSSSSSSSTSSSISAALPKFFKPSYLNKKVKKAYKCTKKGLAQLPKLVAETTDSISTMLKLDKRGRILALIEEVENAKVFVRTEYSKFVITWSPLMESALNYLGDEQLNKVSWNEKDEFDYRQDALNMLAIGHEFHLLMLNWRDEQLMAHSAYKMYLESVIQDLQESSSSSSQSDAAQKPAIKVDDYYLFHLEAIHNYILFKAWLTIDELNMESRMKLAYLFLVNDRKLKNYESDYFRHIIVFQELFEPTLEEFKDERQQVINSVSTAGDLASEYAEMDEFIDDYRKSLSAEDLAKIYVPLEMMKFVDKMKAQLQYNSKLYNLEFLQDLKEAKKRLLNA